MIIVHSFWSAETGYFHIWGEDTAPAETLSRQGIRAVVTPHPFAATHDDLAPLVNSRIRTGIWQTQLTLDGSGRHVQASWLARAFGAATPLGPLTPLQWTVTSLALRAEEVLQFFIELPKSSNYVYDSDIFYWRAIVRLVLQIIEARQYLPMVSGGQYATRAFWKAIVSEPILAHAIRSMPSVCFAGNDITHSPGLILVDFIDALLQAFNSREAKRLSKGRFADPVANALAHGESSFHFTRDKIQRHLKLLKQIEQEISEEAAFRLCLRLSEPLDMVEETSWRLDYLLQDALDRHILLAASDLANPDSTAFAYLTQRGLHPTDAVLPQLVKAGAHFKPIDDSLDERFPTRVTLSQDEAFAFLTKAAPALEKLGIQVLVPGWWARRKRALRAQAWLNSSSSGLLGGDALFDFRWQLALGDTTISREEFEQLVALKQPIVQFKGEWVELDERQIEAARQFFTQQAEQGQVNLLGALKLSVPSKSADSAVEMLPVEMSANVSKLMNTLRHPDRAKPPAIPKGLQASLRPYQERGFGWLVSMRQMGLGACLADDMGLGKTVMTIALWLHESEQLGVNGRRLLVCPTSVLGNWQHELGRFAPSLSVLLHYGTDRLSGQAFAAAADQHDVILTSYALLHRDLNTLKPVKWLSITLDEAQNIKNPSTKMAQAARGLSAAHRLALTGTPVENRLAELWSIFQFLNPGYLGAQQQFNAQFANPIERHGDKESAKTLRQLIAPFILRRVKTDPKVIQDLPPKLETRVYCSLTAHQASLYEAVVRRELALIAEAETPMERRGAVLRMLIYLKQICDHPALYEKVPAKQEHSGKLTRLTEMLAEVLENNERALIFTQYARMGHLLKAHLAESFGAEPLYLYGASSAEQRKAMVEAFQRADGPRLFVLSLKAGGTGLNLTAASHVFHFDRWYNPAVENQATDRAFRIGQTKIVQVHKFICTGTLEERIDLLIQQKQGLADQIIGTGETWLSELSDRELRDLVTLQRTLVE